MARIRTRSADELFEQLEGELDEWLAPFDRAKKRPKTAAAGAANAAWNGGAPEYEPEDDQAFDVGEDGFVTKDEWLAPFDRVKKGSKTTAASMMDTAWRGGAPKRTPEDGGGLVGLVAHKTMKETMLQWVKSHREFFEHCHIVTTESTGTALEESLGLRAKKFVSPGPLSRNQEIGALVSQDKVSAIFFFRDPLSAHMHHANEALTRICDVHNLPYATNLASANAVVYTMSNLGLDFKRHQGKTSCVK